LPFTESRAAFQEGGTFPITQRLNSKIGQSFLNSQRVAG
jgi:hypothetical protein